jgi:hypothetical protein
MNSPGQKGTGTYVREETKKAVYLFIIIQFSKLAFRKLVFILLGWNIAWTRNGRLIGLGHVV